jgi:hypothetical protein
MRGGGKGGPVPGKGYQRIDQINRGVRGELPPDVVGDA